ncbi:MAG TPA: hypothetical protein VLG27_04335 [Candidatus Saccharimonadia bacterium]|nr:hypothetical protein [Candidatus Saccharimonadia bacterium]
MKIKKLDVRGFSHDMLIVGLLMVFAIVGVGLLVAGHASGNANPNNCANTTATAAPTAGKPTPIYDYFNSGLNGQVWKDHYYTLTRNDPGLSAFGYCYQSQEGYAYSTPQPGTVPLHGYWSPTIHKHFYTIAAAKIEPAGCCGYQPDGSSNGIVAYVKSSGTNADGSEPMYRFYNKTSQGHFYTVNGLLSNISGLINLGYTYEGPAFYVWLSPSLVPVATAPSNGGAKAVPVISNPTSPSTSGKTAVTGGTSPSPTKSTSSSKPKEGEDGGSDKNEPSDNNSGSKEPEDSGSDKGEPSDNNSGSKKTTAPKPAIPNLPHLKAPPTWASEGTKGKVDEPFICSIPLIKSTNAQCKAWNLINVGKKANSKSKVMTTPFH